MASQKVMNGVRAAASQISIAITDGIAMKVCILQTDKAFTSNRQAAKQDCQTGATCLHFPFYSVLTLPFFCSNFYFNTKTRFSLFLSS